MQTNTHRVPKMPASRFLMLGALLTLMGAGAAWANNMAVSNISRADAGSDSVVTLTLSWENAWRTRLAEGAADTANNTAQTNDSWDAAWVFLKFRDEGTSSGAWLHGTLSTNTADHTMPAGAACSVGLTGGKGVGVFVYRDTAGHGNNAFTNVQLRWQHTTDNVTNAAAMDLQVHAIEMVYVAPGAFNVGSGETANFAFTSTLITTGNATQAGGYPTGQPVPANATWPNGYNAFYSMKNEVTQGQYANFLNSLSSATAPARYLATTNNRYTISFTNGVYAATRPDRACNFLSYADGASYLAWSGLRLMTELEFEKACRGPRKPVENGYAWGTATIMAAAKTLSGPENGTETVAESPASGAAHYDRYTIPMNGGDGGMGPLRVGIFATPGSTRVTSGASYWGGMEMSGNLWEQAVTISNTQGRAYLGTHGAGTLTLPADWSAAGMAIRGADWSNTSEHLRVSGRVFYIIDINSTRYAVVGVRGVRTAP